MIYQLNLPQPSVELVAEITKIVNNTKLSADGKQWLDQQNSIDNSAEHLFFTNDVVDRLVDQEFGNFFYQPIVALIGVMKNTHSECAKQPPHIDRGRALAINYYIELGGDQVETTFYNITEEVNLAKSMNFTYQEVQNQKIGSVIFNERSWYAFNVCQCHSVENIKTTRYFFSICFKVPNVNTYNVNDLIKDYPTLIGNNVRIC